MLDDTPHHRQELMSLYAQGRECGPQHIQIAASQRRLVHGPCLAGIEKTLARPIQQAVARPWFAEDADAARREHALEFRRSDGQVEMMQDGVAPDAIESSVRERKPF